MMNISDLLRYQLDLQDTLGQFDLSREITTAKHQFNRLSGMYPQYPGIKKLSDSEIKFDNLISEIDDIQKNLLTVSNDINDQIDKLSESLKLETSFHRTDFTTDDSVINTLTANIHHHADFHYPALQLGCTPHSKIFTGELVANDPLYLFDPDPSRVEDIALQFNEIYYRRIRRYTNLDQLPLNQFGFIFSWMFFNYKPYNELQEYLRKMFLLLRPGGRFLFSYNNSDILENCILAEENSMSYISKRQLIEFCNSIGYEIVYYYDLENTDSHVRYINWVEICKPGILTTAKRKQVLGIIHQK